MPIQKRNAVCLAQYFNRRNAANAIDDPMAGSICILPAIIRNWRGADIPVRCAEPPIAIV